MNHEYPFAERIAVAFDPNYEDVGGVTGARDAILRFADLLAGTGAVLKLNTLLRAAGYPIILEIRERGLGIFADVKLHDIPNTVQNDGEFLVECQPTYLTVMCAAGTKAMRNLQEVMPKTNVLGVTVLTSHSPDECYQIYGADPAVVTARFAGMAHTAGLGGLILSPQELETVRAIEVCKDMRLICPGIRPAWSLVAGDDQARVSTPAAAIESGAYGIVIGRPVVKAPDPLDAFRRTYDEVAEVLS